jgi:hypothetical protein
MGDDEVWIGGRRIAVCAHRADLPWFNRRVGSIPILTGRGLVKAIRHGTVSLTTDQVDGLARLAIASLPA